nr:MAG TPA_asm: hypothetical protein [Caudoviricetes sp.]
MDYYCYNRNFGLSFCTPKCEFYAQCRNWHQKQIDKLSQVDKGLSAGLGCLHSKTKSRKSK